MKKTYRRQMFYANHSRRELEFEEGDKVYLKLSPRKGVVRFGKKGKLSPRYVDPYDILKNIGKVAYDLSFPRELTLIYSVFHVYMLKKFIGEPESILPIERTGVQENLCYEEVLVQILDRKVEKLRIKEVASVKVLQKNYLV